MDQPPEKSRDTAAGRRGLLVLLGLAAAAGVASWFAEDVAAAVGEAYPEEGGPYLVPGSALLLYVVTPVTFLATCLFWLSPGLFLAAALGRPARATAWLLLAVPFAIAAQAAASAVAKAIAGFPLGRGGFFLAFGIATAASWLVLLLRGRPLPIDGPRDRRRLVLAVVLVAVGAACLLPIAFWQDLNGDGMEALEFASSLARYQVPRGVVPPGLIGLGNGQVSQSYALFPFTMFFGVVEASVRLPMIFALALVLCALLELIEARTERRIGALPEIAIAGALATYLVVMAYSSSFSPYFADMSSPGTLDTLAVLFQLGMIGALVSRRPVAFVVFLLLAHFARPNGLLVLGLVLVASLLVMRGERRRWLLWTGGGILLCLAGTFLYERIYIPSALGTGEPIFGSVGIVKRLRFLTFTDWERLAILVFPSGILPAAALLLWRRQDRVARMLTLVTAAYFLFFYVNAFISLHHFVPVMILPLVVFWRIVPAEPAPRRRVATLAAAVGVVVSFWLCLPASFAISREARDVGSRTRFLVGDPERGHRSIIMRTIVLEEIMPRIWKVEDLEEEWGGTPICIAFYAKRTGPVGPEDDYVVVETGADPPGGMVRIAEEHGAVLYARSRETIRRDRWRERSTSFESPLLEIPLEVLHREAFGLAAKRYDLDLRDLIPRR